MIMTALIEQDRINRRLERKELESFNTRMFTELPRKTGTLNR